MKKVVVVKLELHDDQAKQKAMKAASKLPGIDSMAIDMKEQKMTVIGEIDPVEVVSKLRKLWNAQIFSVEPVKEPEPKKEEAKKEEPKKEEPKKEEPKKEEEPKKQEPKKEEAAEKKEEPKPSEQNNIAELVKAYQSYNPHNTTYYYVQSAEENPNSCVIC